MQNNIKNVIHDITTEIHREFSSAWKKSRSGYPAKNYSIGLVFEGGGGKGAYEIGVWKAMHELGIDSKISAVSGTSVGALNAALFATGSLANAIKVWSNISPELILQPNMISQQFPPTVAALVGTYDGGFFSQDGLMKLMCRYLEPQKIKAFGGPVFATCTPKIILTGMASLQACTVGTFPTLGTPEAILTGWTPKRFDMPKRFDIREHSDVTLIRILLASAAIPVVYPDVELYGEKYCDGGVIDNLPVEPVYNLGKRHIIVVRLNPTEMHLSANYPQSKITEIIPSQNLGGIIGTFNFSAETAERLIELGYHDGIQALKNKFNT